MPKTLQVAVVFLAIGVSAGVVRSARKCDCVQNGPPCQSAWLADAIVLGHVVSLRESEADGFFSRIARVRVAETFRGTATGDVDIWTGAGGGDCGFSFKAGESYVIYARRESSGRLSTSICTRTRTAANAAEDLAYLRGPMREPAGLGRIVGRAELDGEVRPWDRTPVQGARVIAEGGGRTYEARTAADGTYELRVPTGKYTLRAEVPDGALTASIQPRAEIVDPRICAPADAVVRWNGRVSGRIVGAGREPLAAFAIELVPARDLETGTSYVTYVTRTDDRGRFAFGMMAPGRYYVAYDRRRASTPKPGPLFAAPGGTLFSFELTRGGEAPLADLALPVDVRAIRISGVVSGADGKPERGAIVRVRDAGTSDAESALPVIADDAGRFTVTLVGGRRYMIAAESYATGRFSSSEPLAVDGTADRPAIALTVRPSR